MACVVDAVLAKRVSHLGAETEEFLLPSNTLLAQKIEDILFFHFKMQSVSECGLMIFLAGFWGLGDPKAWGLHCP